MTALQAGPDIRFKGLCATIIETLLLTESIEHQLQTCDLAVPIDTQLQTPSSMSGRKQLRVLFVSTASVSGAGLAETLVRIEHLASISGGNHIAIVYSLQDTANTHKSDQDPPTFGLAKLQSEFLASATLPTVPILLVNDFKDLSKVVKTHCMALNRPAKVETMSRAVVTLPYCKVGPPLDDFATSITSELFHSLKDLCYALMSSKAGLTSEDARFVDSPGAVQASDARLDVLRHQLGHDVLAAMMEFWSDELCVE